MSQPTKQRSIEECHRIMTSLPGMFEIEEIPLNGRMTKVWKNLPPNHPAFFLPFIEQWKDRDFLSYPRAGSSDTDLESLTYAQVLDRGYNLAAWLIKFGVRPGDFVALVGHNAPEWVVSFFAIHLIGGVAVYCNADWTTDILLHSLALTKPKVVLVDENAANLLGSYGSMLKHRKIGRVYSWASTKNLPGKMSKTIRHVDVTTSPGEKLKHEVMSGVFHKKIHPESNACVFFTSGTTGLPKAVLSTQRQSLHNIISAAVGAVRGFLRDGVALQDLPALLAPKPEQTVALLAIPFFHATGTEGWLFRAIQGGHKLVLMRRWNTKTAVAVTVKEKINLLGGVPAIVKAILQSPDLPKDHRVDAVAYGGAPPAETMPAEVAKRWPTSMIGQGYGMTETNATTLTNAGSDYLKRPTSVGVPVPIVESKLVDPDTHEEILTPGKLGVIHCRGCNNMTSYYNDPVATANTLDKDGWVDTGDIAMRDEEGFYYIRDRLKDVIIRGGENIASIEVEDAIYQDTRIAEAAAVAVPDDRMGEDVGIAVSLAPGADATPEDIIRTVQNRLRYAARPVICVIFDEPMPRNINGKLIKREIKKTVHVKWAEHLAAGKSTGKGQDRAKL